MSPVSAVITDFGGVLTTPLLDAFTGFSEVSGVPLEALGLALAALADRDGINPLYELETGRMTEATFLRRVGEQVSDQLGRPASLEGFAGTYFTHLQPNHAMIGHMRSLRERGLRLAICTNNVREWESLWRAKLPAEDLFDVVVDSGFVGVRKPDPAIYEITLERLGVAAEEAVFVDDLEHNCAAAQALGMHAVWFRANEQAIAELERLLDGRPSGRD